MYELKRSAFADQLCQCNSAGACFITNCAPRPFVGVVRLRLLNVLSGAVSTLGNHSVSLGAGAGVTSWFCPQPAHPAGWSVSAADPAAPAEAAAHYVKHAGKIPSDRGGYYLSLSRKTNATPFCEAMCSANETCSGFTQDNAVDTRCWLYASVASLQDKQGDSWYQKVGAGPSPPPTPPSPVPPTPTPLPQLSCVAWAETDAWHSAGCAKSASCVLIIEVFDEEHAIRSQNVSPFVAPKSMQLPPPTAVSVAFGKPSGSRVALTLNTTAAAMYVVLTTSVAGRFSDNAFLMEGGGRSSDVEFESWSGALDEKAFEQLQSSLRVEHLAENL